LEILSVANRELAARSIVRLRISARSAEGECSSAHLVNSRDRSELSNIQRAAVAVLDSRIIEIGQLSLRLQRRLLRCEPQRVDLRRIVPEAELHLGLRRNIPEVLVFYVHLSNPHVPVIAMLATVVGHCCSNVVCAEVQW